MQRSYVFKVVVGDDKHEDGRKAYRAHCPEIEEAMTWGDTREEAMRRIHELLNALVQMRIVRGQPIPTAIPFEPFAVEVVVTV